MLQLEVAYASIQLAQGSRCIGQVPLSLLPQSLCLLRLVRLCLLHPLTRQDSTFQPYCRQARQC